MVLPDPRLPLAGDWPETLHAPFVQQAKRFGDRVAIIGHSESITYTSLEQVSNQLANYLCAHECSGKVVAVYAIRSPALVWIILGILKARAAVLVLDSAYPSTRLLQYTEAAMPSMMLLMSEAGNIPNEMVGATATANILILPKTSNATRRLLCEYSESAPAIEVTSNDIAYIMFTSGTSGKPKGIVGIHSPPSHFMNWHCHTFGFNENDRFCMLSGLAHDIVLRDIFTPLSVGGTLCIPRQSDILPGCISTWIKKHSITVAHLTPPTGLIIIADETSLDSLRYLFFGGDKLPITLVETIYCVAPNATCINFYGATETPQAMGYFVCPKDKVNMLNGSVPVGRGIADVQLLVLTDHQKLAAVGEVGEIAIRSPYLARGYLGDERATSKHFVINPFSGQKGDRIYKTGDMGRYLPESFGVGPGNVEILGRKDNQVNIRGARIELTEVEKAMTTHPKVRQSVVVAVEREHGTCLVAYVVAQDQDQDSIRKEWRAYMQKRVPQFMVPSCLVALNYLPLTPNGKVDHSALPEPTYQSETAIAPLTPIEEKLVQIWQDVLQIKPVFVHDNFFEVGGHSLLAMKVVAAIQVTFSISMAVHEIFECPTVAEIGEKIVEARTARKRKQRIEPTIIVSRNKGQPLSFAQRRLWDWQQLAGKKATYKVSHFRQLFGPLNFSSLRSSFSLLVRRHESLRTSFPVTDGEPEQVIHPDVHVSFSKIDLQDLSEHARGQKVQFLSHDHARRPFDLEQGPLFRVALLRLEPEKHLLLLTFHHIIIDGWSKRQLLHEWNNLYQAMLKGSFKSAILPKISLQYADFAYWQRNSVPAEDEDKELAYWEGQIGGFIPRLCFQKNTARSIEQSFEGAMKSLSLHESLVDALNRLSQYTGSTLYMTLLAAFKALLYHQTGQEDVIVGSPNANRAQQQFHKVVGYFVNPMALRTNLHGNPTFLELLSNVRKVVIGAYNHQELPFEKIVSKLHPQRDLNSDPLFSAWFNMLNLEKQIDFEGVTCCPIEIPNNPAAMFDIALSICNKDCDGLQLILICKLDLFGASQMEDFLSQYHTLLAKVSQQPATRLNDLLLRNSHGSSQRYTES